MTTEIFVGRTGLSTDSVGTTDLTSPDSSTVAEAVLHILGTGNANDTQRTDSHLAFGMADGVTEKCVDCVSQDNVSSVNANRGHLNSCLHLTNSSGGFSEGAASHNSFIAGGQRVDDDNSFAVSRLASHMFFAGCDKSVEEVTLDASVDTAVNVDPGFVWDMVIVSCGYDAAAGFGVDAEISLGFMVKADDAQACISFISDDAATPSDPAMQISNTYSGAKLVKGTGALTYGIDVQAGSGTSCDVFPRIAGGQSHVVQLLFIGFTDSFGAKIVEWDTPTATGNDSITGAGFPPTAMIDLLSFATAYDTATTGAAGGAVGVGISTDDSQFCTAISEQDATGGNTQCEGRSTDVSVSVPTDDGLVSATTSLEASHVSMDADGWTRNWVNRDSGQARKAITLVMGDSSAGSVINRVLTESTVITDPTPGTILRQRIPGDRVELMSDAVFIYTALGRVVQDNFEVQDAHAILQSLDRQLSDATDLTDLLSAARRAFRDIVDSIVAADDMQSHLAFGRITADAAASTDNISAFRDRVQVLDDDLSVTDSFEKQVTVGESAQTFVKVLDEIVTVVDMPALFKSGVHTRDVVDTLAVEEFIELVRFRRSMLSDNFGMTDTARTSKLRNQLLTPDSLAVADVIDQTHNRARVLSDNASDFSDSLDPIAIRERLLFLGEEASEDNPIQDTNAIAATDDVIVTRSAILNSVLKSDSISLTDFLSYETGTLLPPADICIEHGIQNQ